jgi:HD-like signal output (HDOD) protein
MSHVKTLDRRESIAGLESLPAFPEAPRQLLGMAADSRVSLRQIARLIRSDAVFAEEALRLANSAVIGLRYEVTSLLHAVSLLGLDRLKSLVLTVALRDLLRAARGSMGMKHCWRHNLGCALAAEWAATCCGMDAAQAYTAGLMHGLGHFGLAATQPVEWRLIMSQATPETLLQMERERLGIDHIEAASWLVVQWELPDLFLDTCRCDHAKGEIDPTQMPGLAALACETADMLGFAVMTVGPAWDPERLVERLPEKTRPFFAHRVSDLQEVVAYKINLFEVDFLLN